mmetsp:Transcript_30197/g.42109  ORF Transcript_30197/g.42109 Transcript_30197/m.42109 type:complete len:312 (+) Transcript_30197:28-963(+)|eukprot:CAMPEP_0175094118 /NCGR_PEP_ID=MMETSP0086_2-20121207/3402_1 /TAXON_ID=136419 /ORGANISM="Unknown Unknown, Strain D1" /LENGTH=311 /DNA_ID=CAMNT_0016367179 /DNA_START=28 /DNA_END=963 /DNA_ORIENTATION=-
MGQFWSFIQRMNEGGGGSTVFIDFENCQPGQNEEKLHSEVASLLEESKEALVKIEEYKGCAELARVAMNTPSHETELACFEGLLDCVDSIQFFFDFSKKLEKVFPEIVIGIVMLFADEKSAVSTFEALAKQLAQIFEFALKFDSVRMSRPNMSNDFSYYRRLLSKFNRHEKIKVTQDEASGLCMFSAEHIPMMSSLSKAAARALESNGQVTEVLSGMANACGNMLKNKRFTSAETILLCARAMTGSIVLYDLVDNVGVFDKRSPVSIRMCINSLIKEVPRDQAMPLMNAIHYSTSHFDDAPANVQALFDAF